MTILYMRVWVCLCESTSGLARIHAYSWKFKICMLSIWQWQCFCLCKPSSSWYWLYIMTSSCATTVNCCQYVKCERVTATNIGNDSLFTYFPSWLSLSLALGEPVYFGTGKRRLVTWHIKPIYEYCVYVYAKLYFIRIKLFTWIFAFWMDTFSIY